MRLRLALACTCVLAMAGCQAPGVRQAPPASPGTQPSSAGNTPAPPPSPWAAARARGMVFRATGNDPDWTVEVSRSHTPTLFVDIGDSGRQLQVADATVSSDQAQGTVAFRGNAGDGTPVELVVKRGQCQADMSGKEAAAAAQLDVGATRYKGCGRFLIQ